MSGVLYIVATPIGNLDDISQRALSILGSVELIAAEDTRHSRSLLSRYGIGTPMVSLHDHNEHLKANDLIEKLRGGQSIALISDAGTPLISDPGYRLVKLVNEAGLIVSPIPGPSSVITALCAAGLPTDQFYYAGFLAHKNAERLSRLAELSTFNTTLILLESSHRILRLMEQLAVDFSEQEVVIAKELTKIHERFLRGKSSDLALQLSEEVVLQKGEFVVLIDNRKLHEGEEMDPEVTILLKRLIEDLPVKKAVKIVADISGQKKNALYKLALEIKPE
ncbi:MAG: 16S rRNA (cytidine1402-2'-O)-methyltransferase [Gammaproteobacteria bacterium]|jgi:16S rRNA (cytidine1402-2'-O)-methyltransferase